MTFAELEKKLPGKNIFEYLVDNPELPREGTLVNVLCEKEDPRTLTLASKISAWDYQGGINSTFSPSNTDDFHHHRSLTIEIDLNAGTQVDIFIKRKNSPVEEEIIEAADKDDGGKSMNNKGEILIYDIVGSDLLPGPLALFLRKMNFVFETTVVDIVKYPFIICPISNFDAFENSDPSEIVDVLRYFPYKDYEGVGRLISCVGQTLFELSEDESRLVSRASEFILGLEDPVFGVNSSLRSE